MSTHDIEGYLATTNKGMSIFIEADDAINDALKALKALNELELDENGDRFARQLAKATSDSQRLLGPGSNLSGAMSDIWSSLVWARSSLTDYLERASSE